MFATFFVGCVVGVLLTFGGATVWRFWRRDRWAQLSRFAKARVVMAHAVLLLIAGSIIDAFFIEPNWVETPTIVLELGRSKPLRVVQLSDLHIDTDGPQNDRLPDIVNSLRPDVVVITGDSENGGTHLAGLKRLMGRIQAKHKLAVMGNTDLYEVQNVLTQAGFTVLLDQVYEMPEEGARIVGLNIEPWHSYGEIMKDRKPATTIVLHHKPDGWERVQGPAPDLYLCGHTHGGQLRVPFYGALETFSRYGKRFEAGLYREGNTWFYVSRGYGSSLIGPRARFLCRPEVTLFILR